jgi:hypothetical protein
MAKARAKVKKTGSGSRPFDARAIVEKHFGEEADLAIKMAQTIRIRAEETRKIESTAAELLSELDRAAQRAIQFAEQHDPTAEGGMAWYIIGDLRGPIGERMYFQEDDLWSALTELHQILTRVHLPSSTSRKLIEFMNPFALEKSTSLSSWVWIASRAGLVTDDLPVRVIAALALCAGFPLQASGLRRIEDTIRKARKRRPGMTSEKPEPDLGGWAVLESIRKSLPET